MTLKQAKIQQSLSKDMKNKFEIYYQKLATLGAGIKMGFPIHERISRIDRDASLVL